MTTKCIRRAMPQRDFVMFSLIYTQNIINKKEKKVLNGIVCIQIISRAAMLISNRNKKDISFRLLISHLGIVKMYVKIETKIKDTLKDLTISTSAFFRSYFYFTSFLADEIPKIRPHFLLFCFIFVGNMRE